MSSDAKLNQVTKKDPAPAHIQKVWNACGAIAETLTTIMNTQNQIAQYIVASRTTIESNAATLNSLIEVSNKHGELLRNLAGHMEEPGSPPEPEPGTPSQTELWELPKDFNPDDFAV